uniref:Nuclear factor of activated T-cells 5 n=2 Tax=Diabrotica virgifera virgifera TaxID=50390 RepID=A0A6P7FP88_DIAVI
MNYIDDDHYMDDDSSSLIRTVPTSSTSALTMSTNTSSRVVRTVPRCVPLSSQQSSSGFVPLTTKSMATSRYTNVSLQIVKQPEQQHRARYQTEGSRGAVKDRDGNGFPVVQLINYFKPATLQVFIGTDTGRISPHMFYQACKVSGKNSTPCTERKIDGTCVIELQLDPAKDMSATCDCVGILKERNVDVEHRFPDQLGTRRKKKATKCRMIFRTTITLEDGTIEILQVCSQPIVCTQPPGIPEISKTSHVSCPASGGLELIILGKNFLKDTRVVFQQYEENRLRWEKTVTPDREFLQQIHFVCVVPPYRRTDITVPVGVRLRVISSGKTSETHQFVYTPVNVQAPPPRPPHQPPTFFKRTFWQSNMSISKREQDLDMMPPPESSMVPISTRRPSINLPSTSDSHSPTLHSLKPEYIDESSQGSIIEQERYRHMSESSLDAHHGDSNMSMINENSMMSHINENSNISVGNEDSIDLVRGDCMSRVTNICESSLDCGDSNMSIINEGSTCSNVLPSTPLLADQNSTSMEKVMDLRMKMPTVTVADLVNTTAPSIAALQTFGIMEHPLAPLPNQSAQSVENYLNRIEAKPSLIPLTNPTGLLMKNDISQIISTEGGMFPNPKSPTMETCGIPNLREPMFPSSARPFMSSRTQSEVMNIVAKSESSDVPEQQTSPEQTNAMASSAITTVVTALDRSVPTPINTERLDALVNSTVESHLSPTRADSSPKHILINNLTSLVTAAPPKLMIPTHDVMLNSQASLMVPPMINTTMTTPSLGPAELSNRSPNLTSEVILNSQISPSLMCRSSSAIPPETLMAPSPNMSLCQTTTAVEQALLSSNSPQQSLLSTPQPVEIAATLTTGPENAVLLNAAVDLLQTQKKLSDLGTNLPASTSQLTSQAETFTQSFGSVSIPVKEMVPTTQADMTQNVDRMIPQSFTSLTENELINPSCFDQGNNNNTFR